MPWKNAAVHDGMRHLRKSVIGVPGVQARGDASGVQQRVVERNRREARNGRGVGGRSQNGFHVGGERVFHSGRGTLEIHAGDGVQLKGKLMPLEARESLGRALAAEGNQSGALAEYQTALRADPGYTQARCDLGSALLARGDLNEAIAQFQTAVRRDAASPQAQNDLAVALWRQNGASAAEPAIHHLEQALSLNPAYPLARTNLGIILMQVPGRRSEAIELFSAALQMEPADAAAYLGLGNVNAARQLVPDPERLRQLQVPRTDDGTAQ